MKNKHKNKKSWVKAIFIAFILALIFRTFFFQSYIVSSSKMEKTFLDGDFVFVNKITCGARLPITLFSFPFVQNELPFSNIKSYTDLIQFPYFRLASFSKIKRNDFLVFNYPNINDKPIDHKPIYLKRCVALPGDTLKIENKIVYVNSIAENDCSSMKYNYRVVTDGVKITETLLKKYDITEGGIIADIGVYDFAMTKKTADKLLQEKIITNVRILKKYPREGTGEAFPESRFNYWNIDYFGPVIIPRKGQKVNLNIHNIDLYKRIIDIYEDNNLYIDNSKGVIAINGETANSYTFKQDYYFVIDDNRDNAKDSRMWGFLPESHIIGCASFIWFSIDRKDSFSISWDRIGQSF